MQSESSAADTFKVRRACREDSTGVWPLVTSFAVSYVPDRAKFEAAFEAVIQDPSMLAVCAVEGSEVIGYLLANRHPTFFANGAVVWVEEVMVDENQRSRGVGRALMHFAEAWAEGAGAAYVALATRRAAAFYLTLGYDESATFFRRETSAR